MPKPVQYDDANAWLVMVVFLGLALVPTTWVYVRGVRGGRMWAPAAVPGGPASPGSVRSPSVRRRRDAAQVVKLAALLLLWATFAWLVTQVSSSTSAVFDPWQILGLEAGATTREVKRQYRTLSRTLHPDKGGDAAAFMRVSSAYSALTDPQAIENMEKFGHPDGAQRLSVALALPSFMASQENQLLTLTVYLLAFVVVVPALVVGCCLGAARPARYEDVIAETHDLLTKYLKEGGAAREAQDREAEAETSPRVVESKATGGAGGVSSGRGGGGGANNAPSKQTRAWKAGKVKKVPKNSKAKAASGGGGRGQGGKGKRGGGGGAGAPPFPACVVPMLAELAGRNLRRLSRHNPPAAGVLAAAVAAGDAMWHRRDLRRARQPFAPPVFAVADAAAGDDLPGGRGSSRVPAADDALATRACFVVIVAHLTRHLPRPGADDDDGDGGGGGADGGGAGGALAAAVAADAALQQLQDVVLQDCASLFFQALARIHIDSANAGAVVQTLRCVQSFAQGVWDEAYVAAGSAGGGAASGAAHVVVAAGARRWARPLRVARVQAEVYTPDDDSEAPDARAEQVREGDTARLLVVVELTPDGAGGGAGGGEGGDGSDRGGGRGGTADATASTAPTPAAAMALPVHTFMKPAEDTRETFWAVVEDAETGALVALVQTQAPAAQPQTVSSQQELRVPVRHGRRSWSWSLRCHVLSATYVDTGASVAFSALVRKPPPP